MALQDSLPASDRSGEYALESGPFYRGPPWKVPMSDFWPLTKLRNGSTG